MCFMFCNASLFDSDLSNWDTSKVIDLTSMFKNANLFDVDLTRFDENRLSNKDP